MRKPTKDDKIRYDKAFRDGPQLRSIGMGCSLATIWVLGYLYGFAQTDTSICFVVISGVFLSLALFLRQNEIYDAMKLAEDGELLEDYSIMRKT